MALNGFTDITATVTVPKPEYEKLVRGSGRLDIIEALLKKNAYISTGDLKAILGIEESEEKKNESV